MVAAAFAAALVLSQAGPVSATTTLPASPPDTKEDAFPASSFMQRAMAQVFKAQSSGQLTGVALRSATSGFSQPTIYINIWSTTAGKPSLPCALDETNPLTTRASLQTWGVSGWQYFPLTHPVAVAANTQYAIVVCTAVANQFMWSWENAETYAGGSAYLSSGTWMTPAGVKAFDFMAWVSTAVNRAPTLAATHPAVTFAEGTTATNTGTFSDPDGDTLALTASSGSVTAGGSGTWSWSIAAADDVNAQPVTITAGDGHGNTASVTFSLTVTNVAPTARIDSYIPALTNPRIIVPGEQITFWGGYTDPGVLDTHTASWDFGDGASGSGLSPTHAYTASGSYTVTFSVTDDDGGVGQARTTVMVQTASQALDTIASYVQGISSLNAGEKKSLIAKLNAAAASAARGDKQAANNQLNAFLNELQADVKTGKVSTTDAIRLRSAVLAIKAALGTYNRFLEWWPLGL